MNDMERQGDVVTVTYNAAKTVVTLTMNRSEKRNALNTVLITALRTALRDAALDPRVRVVILTGAGSAYSAGADLAALNTMQTAGSVENLDDSRQLAALFEEIYLHPKAVIAMVNHHAIAGGCGLAAVCDFSLASTEAKLGFTEVRIGFVPAIVMVFVLRKVGEAAARDLLLRGRLVTAAEAAAMGLITRAVAAGELKDHVSALADELARETSSSAVMLTKRMLATVPGLGLREALDHAAMVNAFARGTEDCKQGVAAFLERTAPPWKRTEEKK